MGISRLTTIVGFAAAALVLACSDSDESTCTGADCGGVGATGGSGGGAMLECPPSGVLYGPWSLRFDETSAVVRWDGCAAHDPSIVIVPEAGGAEDTVTGEQTESDVLTDVQIIEGVAPDLPGTRWLSEVAVGGLEPGACYAYHLVAEPERSGRFCTAKPSGDPYRLMAIGDTNPTFGDTAGVLAHALPENPDFVLHVGDIEYYASVFETWAGWFPLMQPLLAQGAFMPAIGNHEDEAPHELQDYYERLFGGAGFDGTIEYYRYEAGGVWFFSLDTEIDDAPGSPQADWLEAQIADAAAQPGYRAGVVYFHKPWITLADYSQNSSARNHFRPIFEQYGVVLVLQGHVHGYERFVDGTLTYVTTGGGGALLHDLDVHLKDRPEEAALRVASASVWHSTILDVGATAIHGRAISNEGEVLDEFDVLLP